MTPFDIEDEKGHKDMPLGAEKIGSLEKVLIRKDGTTFPAEVSSRVFYDRDRPTVLSSIRDITGRKEAERKLKESEAVQQMAHVGHWERDLSTGKVRWSDETYRIFGLRPQECKVDGPFLFQHIHPDDRARVEKAMRDAAEGIQPYDEIYRFVRPDGTIRWVHARAEVTRTPNGKPIRISGTMLDITERKRAEETLKRAKEEWERTFASVPDMVAIIDGKYSILRVNEAMARRLGRKSDECIGLRCYEAVHGTSEPPDFCPHSRTFKDGRQHIEEVREDRLGGYFVVSTTPLHDEQGQMIGTVHVAHDITERKKAEEALRESEKLMHRAQEIAHLGSWELDLLNNRLTWSDEVYRIFGLQPQEFTATYDAFLDAVHPDDRAAVDAAYSGSLYEGKDTYDIEHRVVRKSSGEVRIVQAKCGYIRDKTGRIVKSVGMVHDITDRKTAEEALKKAYDDLELRVQERTAELKRAYENLQAEVGERKRGEELLAAEKNLATALSGTSDLGYGLGLCLETAMIISGMDIGGIYLVSRYTGDIDLAVHRNLAEEWRAAVAHYGPDTYNARLVRAGKPIYTTFRELNLKEFKEPFRALAILPICHEGRAIACLNLGSKRFDEVLPPVRMALETIAAQVGSALIRIQAEQDNARLAAAVESATEPIVMTDPSWVILYVNPAFSRFTGYTSAEAIGREMRFLRLEQEDPVKYEKARQAAVERRPIQSQYSIRGKDGTALPVESEVFTVTGRSGEVSCFVVIYHDIAERLRLEEQHRQAQRMEALGTLAGGIAHDFNNVLAIIIGNAELALDDLEARARPRENINQIITASKRASDLIKQILAFSRKTEQARATFSLALLVKETLGLLRSSLPSTVKMKLNSRIKSGTMIGDPSQIQQVLMNLATNAAHAMREKGGTLSVGISNVTFRYAEKMPEPDMQPGRYMKLRVEDTGTGIAEDVRERMFEPFFTTKEVGQGTGMGLAVVYGIVRSHGGTISVESRPGHGSIFNVFLRRAKVRVKEEQGQAGVPPGGTERILFVDDEAAVVEMTSQELLRLGYDVTTAESGSEAWKIFGEEPERFDLVVTDQTMPDVTGMELAKRMLEIRKDMPIILITGYSEIVSPEKAQAVGISEFLLKPVVKVTLAETVRRVLDRKEPNKKTKI